MKYYASIDPGKWSCGIAVWDRDFQLVRAELVKSLASDLVKLSRPQIWEGMARAAVRAVKSWTPLIKEVEISLIQEIPQVYEKYQDADKNDLVDLAGVQGGIAALSGWEVPWAPLPREWKGQLKKHHSEERVRDRLSAQELARVVWPAKSLCHNVWDTLHLGLVFAETRGIRVRSVK